MALKDVLVAKGEFTIWATGRLVKIGHVIHEAVEYAEAELFHHHSVVRAKHDIPDAAPAAPAAAPAPVADDHHE